LKWLPWKWLVSLAARRHGFLDPLKVISHLRRFSEPSEVAEPLELLRAGLVFHARGLINSRAIQHNMDWVWPFWVERQFNPLDHSFVPRAFSLTHINLTHRNWTAVGTPSCYVTPIVDPRGLLTPFFDGWSLDGWIVGDDGQELIPSRLPDVEQRLHMKDQFFIRTKSLNDGMALHLDADVVDPEPGHPLCRLHATALSDQPAWLVLSLRPCNPEGISLVHRIEMSGDRTVWRINDKHLVEFHTPAERYTASDYKSGDAFFSVREPKENLVVECDVGMATAAAMYRLEPGQKRDVRLSVDLHRDEMRQDKPRRPSPAQSWGNALKDLCQIQVPNKTFQFLFDVNLRALILHSPADVYPGPYTYKRFWFRDAAFMVHAMLKTGMTERARRVIDRFGSRQNQLGYFLSQEGEWDSNGEALWTMRRYCELAGEKPPKEWRTWIRRGAEWIIRKRLPNEYNRTASGLLPAGFSAEHLGPNDCYYWDDFWSVAGLRAASWLMTHYSDAQLAEKYAVEADDFMRDIESSLEKAAQRLGRPAMPAAPERRLDAGAIGSIVAGYPLQLWPGDDPRLLDTVEYLERECLIGGCFFQNIIHSGLNPYLTLHIAQIHLSAGDPRYLHRMVCVSGKASPTGQWPEAVHPLTGGGCMGDGQHIWAAAEWLLMMIHCFVREEQRRLVIGSGIPAQWLEQDEPVLAGPIHTPYGTIHVQIEVREGRTHMQWQARWTLPPESLEVALPGFEVVVAPPEMEGAVVLAPTPSTSPSRLSER